MTLATLELTATAELAREMVRLEALARQADADFELLDYSSALWHQRDEVRHERSLLLRHLWRGRAERLWAPL